MTMDLAECLFNWIKNAFELEGPNARLKDLTDGVALTHALYQIDPEHFSPLLLSKIEKSCASWFFKNSNLRMIYDCIDNFYIEVIERCIPEKFTPNLELIARDDDLGQLTLLLQLILGVAINCAEKEKHIEVMKYLPHDVKHGLKIAIDELENFDDTASLTMERNASPIKAHYTSEEFQKLKEALKSSNSNKEKITEKCLELETFVQQLNEDKKSLKQENEKLVEKLRTTTQQKSINSTESALRFDSIEHENLFARLNNQINILQADLSKTEEQRDDFRMQLSFKDQEYHRVVLNLEQLQSKLADFKHDRDELDRLRYLNEEVVKYQNITEVQKKKLEEFVELKKQLKSMEERNATLIKQTCELEEEKKQLAVFKGQVELLKKQREELRTKTYEESFRADKAEDELKRLHKKFSETLNDKEKLQFDYERLQQQQSTVRQESMDYELKQNGAHKQTALDASLNPNLQSSDLQEKLIRIEFENNKLKKELEQSNDERVKLLESQLEDEHSRLTNYEAENRVNKQKIIELEGQLSDFKTSGSIPADAKTLRIKLKELESEKVILQQTIEKRNIELQEKEQRFQKHLIKAKETYEVLQNHSKLSSIVSNQQASLTSGEPHSGGGGGGSGASSTAAMGKHSDELCYWKNLASQKDAEIEKMKQDIDFREMEERLMAVSFHNLSCTLQRKAAESRLHPENYQQSSTFLQQQRQASSQNLMIPRTAKWFNKLKN